MNVLAGAGCGQGQVYIQYLAGIVESSDDAIVSKSLEGSIKSWKRGGEKMFGYTAVQAIGKHICRYQHQPRTAKDRRIVQETMSCC